MIETHPVIRDTAILPTRPLSDLVEQLRQWLSSRLPGAIVWGSPRIGKTQAITYILNNGRTIFQSPMPISILNAWDPTYSSLTENRFFREVLESIGYASPASGTAADKRRRAATFMIDRVQHVKEYRYLLFIDEAQWLDPVQMRYLMDLHNLLKRKQVRLITILVGQPEIMELKDSLRQAGQNHFLGRFMTDVHRFDGMESASDLKELCLSFDDRSEYPEGSSVSFTAYFVPQAWEGGWRLAEQVPLVWRVLQELIRAEGVARCKELPMQPMMALLVRLLELLREEDRPDLTLERAPIEEALLEGALIQISDHACMKHPVCEHN